MSNNFKINASVANRKVLREHAKEALLDYSPLMTWLVLSEEGDLSIVEEPQGQAEYVGGDQVVATTGSFHKAHGDGAAVNKQTGQKFVTQKEYLVDLLGESEYSRIFS